ncbi:hypothetical protein TSAR_003195 [Trichomalopsis sarcophagae]|uniref:CCHC-type domain-containing protein n=1 Tax=Trichomalopsis sarcophagae TaxID=543379 RepID=A0A232EIN5_9HYME|nr:hypothetical protein TSAR_003195 [Trichomalopsis sarcophagae]
MRLDNLIVDTFLRTQELIQGFKENHGDEIMFAQIRNDRIHFITESGKIYDLGKEYFTVQDFQNLSSAIEEAEQAGKEYFTVQDFQNLSSAIEEAEQAVTVKGKVPIDWKSDKIETGDSKFIQKNVQKLASSFARNENQLATETSVSESISDKGSTVRREYKLTEEIKYEYFMDLLRSELQANDVLYIIDSTDPVKILNRIKEIKLSETNVTSTTIRRQLYTIQYNPPKDKAKDFIDRFEELTATGTALSTEVNLEHIRCYQCDGHGHRAENCSMRESGLKKCFECKKFTNHIAANCPVRRQRNERQQNDWKTTERNENQLATETYVSESISDKGSTVRREYKLTEEIKYEYFMDLLRSELQANDVLYIIDSTDPVKILNRIKEIKLSETNVTSTTIRRQLYTIQYNPPKDKAKDFIDRFEELVGNYNNLSDIQVFSEIEKSLTYDKMKMYVMQMESLKNQTPTEKTTQGQLYRQK